jgi:hypothetical protein
MVGGLAAAFIFNYYLTCRQQPSEIIPEVTRRAAWPALPLPSSIAQPAGFQPFSFFLLLFALYFALYALLLPLKIIKIVPHYVIRVIPLPEA